MDSVLSLVVAYIFSFVGSNKNIQRCECLLKKRVVRIGILWDYCIKLPVIPIYFCIKKKQNENVGKSTISREKELVFKDIFRL